MIRLWREDSIDFNHLIASDVSKNPNESDNRHPSKLGFAALGSYFMYFVHSFSFSNCV